MSANEIVISEEVKELAAELWKNSIGLSTTSPGWSPPLASFQREVELKVQALLNASTARLREEAEKTEAELKSWILAAFNCGIYRADIPHNTPQLWQMAQVDATAKLLSERDTLRQQNEELKRHIIAAVIYVVIVGIAASLPVWGLSHG